MTAANSASCSIWRTRQARFGPTRANLALLDKRGLVAQFQRVKPRGKPMPPHIARGNATRARVRSRVEHVLAAEKWRMGLVVRTVRLMRATAKITLANLAYAMRRLAWIDARLAPARPLTRFGPARHAQ
jgi:hypothetical protein